MRFKYGRLNDSQIEALAKICFNTGQALFLGVVVAFVIPPFAGKEISLSSFLLGVFGSLTFIIVGLILLKERR